MEQMPLVVSMAPMVAMVYKAMMITTITTSAVELVALEVEQPVEPVVQPDAQAAKTVAMEQPQLTDAEEEAVEPELVEDRKMTMAVTEGLEEAGLATIPIAELEVMHRDGAIVQAVVTLRYRDRTVEMVEQVD